MPASQTMRSGPESTGKKDLRAEKDSAPSPDQAVEAGTAEAQVDQVELSDSVVRAMRTRNSMHLKLRR